MRCLRKSACAAAVALAGLPSAALGQVHSNDPSRGSPAGAVYQIPLEQGRSDAAPPARGAGSGGSGSGAGSGGAPVSPIHTANGFGSSSTVPGAAAAATPGAPAGRGTSSSRPTRAGRTGSSRQRARKGASALGEAAIPPPGAVQPAGGTSALPRALLLLGLGVAVALLLGAGARLAARRR